MSAVANSDNEYYRCWKCNDTKNPMPHYYMYCVKCYTKWEKEEWPECLRKINIVRQRLKDKIKRQEEWRKFWDE